MNNQDLNTRPRDVEQHSLHAIAQDHSGLARKAIDYTLTMKCLVDQAKQRGFTAEEWNRLGTLVNTTRFERIGTFKEVMNWREYVEFLTLWAPSAEWDCTFRRVTECGNLATLELEERITTGLLCNVVNSISVYEFDNAGQIVHVDTYLQMTLPYPAMLDDFDADAAAD